MTGNSSKRVKIDQTEKFAAGLFDSADKLMDEIAHSEPYKHGVIHGLMDDSLLRKVRKEILQHLSFTAKETDIYKVNQTGDLANMSGLDSEELSKLSSLEELRSAMYSQEFRDFLSYVCQSGPLSGTMQDLSINIYNRGSHLLNHDDVIGTRRISYILYLPDPDERWDPAWGGALRLYTTTKPNIPEPYWSLSIPPQWNQMAFFTVQPGRSFHDVEEVYVDKTRLSVSGWFHIPQPGEEGFKLGEKEEIAGMSTLQQLQSKELEEFDFPKSRPTEYSASADEDKSDRVFEWNPSEEDLAYLSKFMDSALLQKKSIDTMKEKFAEESMAVIKNFLRPEYASALKQKIQALDGDGQNGQLTGLKDQEEQENAWNLAKPPQKWRYLYTQSEKETAVSEVIQLFKSQPFREWLEAITEFQPSDSDVIARRFRPGLDYTLATSHDSDIRTLEATLDLTPTDKWEDGELGGYELIMTGDDDDEKGMDPAVYRSSKSGDNEDDAVILNNPPEWNQFVLVLKDRGILQFVKYVSKNAPGSRFDVNSKWGLKGYPDDYFNEYEDELGIEVDYGSGMVPVDFVEYDDEDVV